MKKNRKWLAAAVLLAVLAVCCGGILIFQEISQKRAQEEMQQLALQTQGGMDPGTLSPNPDGADRPGEDVPESGTQDQPSGEEESPLERDIRFLEENGIPVPDKEIDFEALQTGTNKDIYAWVYVPDSKIDYPVLQHGTDDAYYLNHNLDGSKGYPGCIYSESLNNRDFSDPNTVLYGHNMKNGTMFNGLHRFEDSQYFEEHPYIYIYTPDRLLVYGIYGAYEFNNIHLLLGYDMGTEYGFGQYLDEVMETRDMNTNFREELLPGVESRILTLSTCVSGKSEKRYLVQGVLLNED